MAYGQDVPLALASAGMRRIAALAYLLVWTWQEHVRASELLNQTVARQIVFLIDEVEAHLHPRWQRLVLTALLGVMDELTGTEDVPVQLIATTHSPMVLASLEPIFDEDQDALWSLDLVDNQVELHREPWRRRGDANAWLTSSSLDLAEPRSLEAERAIRRANELGKQADPDAQEIAGVEEELRAVLGDVDPFWVGWRLFERRAGGVP